MLMAPGVRKHLVLSEDNCEGARTGLDRDGSTTIGSLGKSPRLNHDLE